MPSESKNFFQVNRDTIVVVILSLLVPTIYLQTTGYGFINLDDTVYVYQNTVVTKGLNSATIAWAFKTFHAANWHPLTWLSHELDVEMFGLKAGGHHATSFVIHLINSILAFVVFRRMTGGFWTSVAVAVLFAVHPTHVESVAWVAERKDVLSTLFWFLTMLAYLNYATAIKNESINEKFAGISLNPKSARGRYYLLAILLFTLGLMSKPMLVSLPFVLVLCDFWPLERLKKLKDLPSLLVEKIPVFVLGAISCYITVLAQRAGGAIETLDYLPIQTRVLNAFVSYAKYIWMFFYPFDLGVWYPYEKNIPLWQIASSVLLLAAITALCIWQIRTRKYLLMGWLWFLGTLVPVIGIVQVGGQSLADRYTYAPYFGLLIMLVWGVFDLFRHNLKAFVAVFGVAVIALTAISYRQTSLWQSNEMLYQHTLLVTKRSFLIEQNLCFTLMSEDRLDEAEPLCRASIAEKPNSFEVYNTLGIILTKRMQFAEAEETFKKVVSMQSNYLLAYVNLSIAQSLQGKSDEAEDNLETAYRLGGPQTQVVAMVSGLNELSIAYAKEGRYDKTAECLNRILHLSPENIDARLKLSMAFYKLKRLDEAQSQIEETLRQNPNLPEAYNLYGLILLEKGQRQEATRQFEKVLQLKPDSAEAKKNLQNARGEK